MEILGISIGYYALLASVGLTYLLGSHSGRVSRLKLKLRRLARKLEDKSVLESEVKEMKIQLSLPPHRRLVLQVESESSAEGRRFMRKLRDRHDILASRI